MRRNELCSKICPCPVHGDQAKREGDRKRKGITAWRKSAKVSINGRQPGEKMFSQDNFFSEHHQPDCKEVGGKLQKQSMMPRHSFEHERWAGRGNISDCNINALEPTARNSDTRKDSEKLISDKSRLREHRTDG